MEVFALGGTMVEIGFPPILAWICAGMGAALIFTLIGRRSKMRVMPFWILVGIGLAVTIGAGAVGTMPYPQIQYRGSLGPEE